MNICTCAGCRGGNDCIGEGSAFWSTNPALAMAEQQERDLAHAEALEENVTTEQAAERFRRALVESDHAEALEENAMHDAAVSAAQDLTVELLDRYADANRPLPSRLRAQLRQRRTLRLVPPNVYLPGFGV